MQKVGQAQDLQAAHRLIEAISAYWRIDEEANEVVLVNLDGEGHVLGAWILPGDERERAVKALLAEEGEYHPQSEAERLELAALVRTLEVPEDED